MSAATTDKLQKVAAAGSETTLASPGKAIGASTINIANAAGWPTDTGFTFAIRSVDASGNEIAGTYAEFIGTISGTVINIGNAGAPVYGTDQVYQAGAATQVFIPLSSYAHNQLITALLLDHLQNGGHGILHDTNGNAMFDLQAVANSVNNFFAKNAATGTALQLGAEGSDTNIPINLIPKGNQTVQHNGVAIDPSNSFQNVIMNGSCQVAQRVSQSLSTSYQYAGVDRIATKASGSAVSAGTIQQNTSPNVGNTGYSLQVSGATITGTGIVYFRYRIEARDALRFKNAAASFGLRVYHNVGSNINYTIYIRKANSADNFSATTDIANSGAISVPSGVDTAITFPNINSGNIGDVSNGIEIEIQAACGAVTTKNFEICQLQFNKGAVVLPFNYRKFSEELRDCQRYYVIIRDTTQGYCGFAAAFVGSGNFQIATPVTLRALPTLTWSGAGFRFGGTDFNYTAINPNIVTGAGVDTTTTCSGSPANGNSGVAWTNAGKLYLDAEL